MLAARSSECTIASMVRVSTKSAADSDHPCQGMSTESGVRRAVEHRCQRRRQRVEVALHARLEVGGAGGGVGVGGGAHVDVRLVVEAGVHPRGATVVLEGRDRVGVVRRRRQQQHDVRRLPGEVVREPADRHAGTGALVVPATGDLGVADEVGRHAGHLGEGLDDSIDHAADASGRAVR